MYFQNKEQTKIGSETHENKILDFKDKNNEILGIYQEKDNKLVVWKNFV